MACSTTKPFFFLVLLIVVVGPAAGDLDALKGYPAIFGGNRKFLDRREDRRREDRCG